jgi:plasmid maintenance system antidote protein VapI
MNENYSYWLLETFKKVKGLSANKDLVTLIDELSESHLSNIKAGRRHLTPEQAMFIAEQCGMDIGEVLVRLDMETSKSPAVKAELQKVLKRLAGVFAALVLTLNLAGSPSQSDAVTPA